MREQILLNQGIDKQAYDQYLIDNGLGTPSKLTSVFLVGLMKAEIFGFISFEAVFQTLEIDIPHAEFVFQVPEKVQDIMSAVV